MERALLLISPLLFVLVTSCDNNLTMDDVGNAEFAYKFSPQEPLQYRTTTDMLMAGIGDMHQARTESWTMKEARNEGVVVEVTTNSVKSRMTQPGGKLLFEYDSSVKGSVPSNPLAVAVAQQVGTSMRFTVSNRGEVTDLSGHQSL